jgi:hypothetical protein
MFATVSCIRQHTRTFEVIDQWCNKRREQGENSEKRREESIWQDLVDWPVSTAALLFLADGAGLLVGMDCLADLETESTGCPL